MRQKKSEMETLVEDWLEALSARIKQLWDAKEVEKARHGRQSAKLVIGAYAHILEVKNERYGAKFTEEQLLIPQTQELVQAFRDRMDQVAWPLILKLKIDHEKYWHIVEIEDVGIAGAMPRGRGAYENGRNIDELIEASHLIGDLCPPSNRPIRSWSTQDNLVGAEHVHILGIHAKTEAEVVLKKLFNMMGIKKLRDIHAGKPIEEGEWLTRVRFVATDLEDLDLNPMGRSLRGLDALAQIAAAQAELAQKDCVAPSP